MKIKTHVRSGSPLWAIPLAAGGRDEQIGENTRHAPSHDPRGDGALCHPTQRQCERTGRAEAGYEKHSNVNPQPYEVQTWGTANSRCSMKRRILTNIAIWALAIGGMATTELHGQVAALDVTIRDVRETSPNCMVGSSVCRGSVVM